MQKELQIKRMHHYVWSFYMKGWSKNVKEIYYTTKKTKKICLDSVKSIAVESGFYNAKPLSDENLNFIHKYLENCSNELQSILLDYLYVFLKIQNAELSTNCQEELKRKSLTLKALNANTLENFHSHHELEIVPILQSLRKGSLSALREEENLFMFLLYLGHQITRTKNIKDKIALAPNVIADSDERFNEQMTDCWWLVSYLMGWNIGLSFFKSRNNFHLSLLESTSNLNFITADSPFINLQGQAPELFEFYYPISPRRAVVYSNTGRFKQGKVDVSERFIEEANTLMAINSNHHIMGLEERDLKPYIRFVGSKLKSMKV